MKAIIAVIITMLGITAATAADGGDAYGPNELSLSFFGGWVDKDDSSFAPGVGVSYFLTRHLGVGATTHWDNYDGTFIDNMSAEAYVRLPLSRLSLAPYGVVAFGYNFETEETFETFGGGLEWRFSPKWGVFGDARWQFNNDSDDGVALRVGLRLVF